MVSHNEREALPVRNDNLLQSDYSMALGQLDFHPTAIWLCFDLEACQQLRDCGGEGGLVPHGYCKDLVNQSNECNI